jgi:filamentous hemagglutinin
MAVVLAQRSGNWSDTNPATSPWLNGIKPSSGDTVFSNTWTVTIDENVTIGGTSTPTHNCGSFVTGQWYIITIVGAGATFPGAASAFVGVVFQATGAGSGTGTARLLGTITNQGGVAGATAGGGFLMTAIVGLNVDIRAGSANVSSVLNITATSGTLLLTSVNITGGTGTNSNAIVNSSTGSISCSSCSIIGGTGTNSNAIVNSSTGSISCNGGTINGGNNITNHGISNDGNGTVTCNNLTMTGGVAGGTTINNGCNAIRNNAGGIINCSICNINGGNGGGANGHHCINNVGVGSVVINSSIIIHGTSCCGVVHGVRNTGPGNIRITSSSFSTSVGAPGSNVVNSGSGVVEVLSCVINGVNGTLGQNSGAILVNDGSGVSYIENCTLQGGTLNNAVSQSSGLVRILNSTILANSVAAVNSSAGTLLISGNILNAPNGTAAIYAPSYRIDPVPQNSYIRYARNGTGVGSDAYLFQFATDSLSAFSMPPVSAVRSGVTFANATLTGTCAVPSPSSVAFGVPTDNTIGQAVFSTNTFFDLPLSAINTPDTIGIRVKNAATIEGAGHLIASFSL